MRAGGVLPVPVPEPADPLRQAAAPVTLAADGLIAGGFQGANAGLFDAGEL